MLNAPFSSLAEFKKLLMKQPNSNLEIKNQASERNNQLTKPPGSLGRLEELAIWYSSWRGEVTPKLRFPQIVVFAGNHGVTTQGISAFPSEVTQQMVMNFQHGGAAINQLCKVFGVKLNVIALDLDNPTADLTTGPAMSEAECVKALTIGWNAVDKSTDLFVAGEMGIGNTTSAAAISYALYGGAASDWVGRGTGIDDIGLEKKAQVIATSLISNPTSITNGIEALRCLGGRELAAMAGSIASARAKSIPVILDGFICSAAAACLENTISGSLDHCVAGHESNENAHRALLGYLKKEPILTLGMRLGEASGGALAIAVLQGALACHSGMATFAEAGVSEG
jgi:nicotinate-nucleotide--dimethylbenzimidazole phosphoribosyltransferase|tara:strand:- start:21141 stop:22160 length:1020 start_codon:yes stop_codon:yes gene_type:complete